MEKTIAVLKGDGIGPEVIDEGLKVLNAISRKYNHTFHINECLIGAHAIFETGVTLPAETLRACKSSDAVYLGAIGHPSFDNDPSKKIRPEQGLLAIRKELELYANIRPLKIYKNLHHLSPLKEKFLLNVDFTIYRELTGGIYFGDKIKEADSASDVCHYEKYEIKRIAKLAFEEAQRRDKKLCLIDKANVLETSRLWRRTVQEMSSSYEEVEISYLFIDNAAMQMILNPSQFDVILTSNMFGDIISDEASVLGGSLGLLPSGSYGNRYRMYEPVHGSYPQAKGKNIANPLAAILSLEMMLRDFNLIEEADEIVQSVEKSIEENILTRDLNPDNNFSTSDIGDYIIECINSNVNQCTVLN